MSRKSSITTWSEFLAVGAIARRCAQGCLANLSGGIETVISRGFGLNQVASMNMAPYVRPPMTPINVRNRNRLGMDQPFRQAISRKTMEKLGQAAMPPAAAATFRRRVNHTFGAPAMLKALDGKWLCWNRNRLERCPMR